MKNLVFGALISALSVTAFADPTPDTYPAYNAGPHSMHHDSTDVIVNITSTGTEVRFAACQAGDAPAFADSRPVMDSTMTGENTNSQSFSLNSLHYGESFTICKRIVFSGGYLALHSKHQIVIDGDIDLLNVSGGDYLTHSGLKVTPVVASCKKGSGLWGWLGSPQAAQVVGDTTVLQNVIQGSEYMQGFPDFCVVKYTFQETNLGKERESTSGEIVKFDLNLDVRLDYEKMI